MEFTFSIGDLAIVATVIIFLAKLEANQRSLAKSVETLRKQMGTLILDSFPDINQKIAVLEEKVSQNVKDIEELKVFKEAIAAKLRP